ncbi:hypothetical protein ABFB50_00905 [Dehalococcoides sp. THU3]|uniref:hypothetical protein n=1 Tax=Dehalococcoides TaxID=61434 RepID=UPI0032182155
MVQKANKKTSGKTVKKVGRPRINIDWETAKGLCEILCTQEEIASVLRVSVDTLERAAIRKFNHSLSEFMSIHSEAGKASLRRAQWKSCMGVPPQLVTDKNGNVILDRKGQPTVIPGIAPSPTMQIWLGKQYLGQVDKQEITGKNGQELMNQPIIQVISVSAQQATQRITAGEGTEPCAD